MNPIKINQTPNNQNISFAPSGNQNVSVVPMSTPNIQVGNTSVGSTAQGNSWSTPLPDHAANFVQTVEGLGKGLLGADKYIANNLGISQIAGILNPQNSQQQKYNNAKQLVTGAVKFPIQAGEQLGQTITGASMKGYAPSLQTQYAQVKKTNGKLPAILETGLSGAMDVAPLLGAVKVAPKIPETNEIGAVGKNVGGTPIQPPDFLKVSSSYKPRTDLLSAEDKANLSPKEQMSLAKIEGMGPKEPIQPYTVKVADPNKEIPLVTQPGNVQGAIGEATGIADQRKALFNKAVNTGAKLSQEDKVKLSDALNGEDVGKVDNPSLFAKVRTQLKDAYNYSLKADRTGGGATEEFNKGKFSPLYFKADPAAMDKLGIPEEQRYQLNDGTTGFRDGCTETPLGRASGFHNISRKYTSYTDAANKTGGILQPLHANAIEDAIHYANSGDHPIRSNLLFTTLKRAAPEHVSELATGRDVNGRPFTQAAGRLPFNVSNEIQPALRNFRSSKVDNPIAEGALKIAETAGKATRKVAFIGAPIHYINTGRSFLDTMATAGHPIKTGQGLGQAFGAALHPRVYSALEDAATKSGVRDFARQIGMVERDTRPNILAKGTGIKGAVEKYSPFAASMRNMNRWINVLSWKLAEGAKNAGVEAGTARATGVGKEFNYVTDRMNAASQGLNPIGERLFASGSLAPHWIRANIGLVYHALKESVPLNKDIAVGDRNIHIGGTGKTGFGLSNAGDIARANVLGGRLLNAAIVITAGAIATGKLPTLTQMFNESGSNPNNPIPNIQAGQKNPKGEGQVLNIPTDAIGMAAGLLTDPLHFFTARETPALSGATQYATNKSFNQQPLADPNSPNYQAQKAAAAAKALEPFTAQNAQNPYLDPAQKILQTFGFRTKTDPNDPQVKANAAHFALQAQLSNDLKKSSSFGQQDAQTFNNLHPTGTTDMNGFKYPTRYDPLSSSTKYDAYVNTDAQGHATLSPVFAADQKLNAQNSNYPSSPLYKLGGSGTDVDGNKAPQALVALEYQHAQDPAAKTVIMDANGGQNGWLGQYENQVADYSKNYQQNLTNYFMSQGWNAQAITDYWTKHPSTPDPIDAVNFDKPTTDLINQYYQLSASGDSTAASQFFSQNADTLGPAFDQIAEHANALRSAKGELQMQGYPTESANVKAIMDAWPTGSDAASKKARGVSINSNPDVNQYLADIALYEALGKGAQFRYQNPANMSATEGQNINAGGQAGQTYLKNTVNMGTYDIGKNPTTGQYDFMQGGALPTGDTTGSGLGSSKKKPLVAFPKKLKSKRLKFRRAPHQRNTRARLAKQQPKINIRAPRTLQHIAVARPSQVVKIRA